MKKKLLSLIPALAFCALSCAVCPATSEAAPAVRQALYVGSDSCKSCHEKEYTMFQKHSKKAHTRKRIELMAGKLTADELQGCFRCHSTGYGKGGFVDYATTPQLADVGCESCHGAGSLHVQSGDPADISMPTQELCASCHTDARMAGFGGVILMYSGAH